MNEDALVEGDDVSVFFDVGMGVGWMWSRGFIFVRYDVPGYAPVPTCQLKVVEGRYIGSIVRYPVNHVRRR